MACPAVLSGSNFLATAMAHLDCQGQTIGAYGYAQLAHPGSSVSIALGGVLTLFVALFGARLMLGQAVDGHDLLTNMLRIGIVLTLATSWPAWRVVGYDVVMQGPEQLAGGIGRASGLWDGDHRLAERIQGVDNGMVAVTAVGSGRLTGSGGGGGQTDASEPFRGIALPDYEGLGWGRLTFLVGTLGPYALLRVGAGILLAVAPLMAGLLLFNATLPIFLGWLRGLVFCALGSMVFALTQGTQLAVLEPWIGDVLRSRDANSFVPSAPTELLAMALAFAIALFALLGLIARICFAPGSIMPRSRLTAQHSGDGDRRMATAPRLTFDGHPPVPMEMHSRAQGVADAVATTMRREDTAAATMAIVGSGAGGRQPPSITVNTTAPHAAQPLGSTFRRSQRRVSGAGNRRDARS